MNTPTQAARSTRIVFIIVVVLTSALVAGGTLVSSPIGAATATVEQPVQTNQNSTQNQTQNMHTLEIIYTNESARYLVMTTGKSRLVQSETSDSITEKTVVGTIGEQSQNNTSTDTRDVIHYRGHITSFESDNKVRVKLDGKQIDPVILNGHHVTLANDVNGSNPALYNISVTGTIIPGESAEQRDFSRPYSNTVSGRLAKQDNDSFYYTGTLTEGTVDHEISVFIDGQEQNVAQPQRNQSPQNNTTTAAPNQTHTLVISGEGNYSLSTYGEVGFVPREREASDRSVETLAEGTVGGSDKRDVIRYTGEILNFRYDEGIRITLDGERVSPESIGITKTPVTVSPTTTATNTTSTSSSTPPSSPTSSPTATADISEAASPPSTSTTPSAPNSTATTASPTPSTDGMNSLLTLVGGMLGVAVITALGIVLWRRNE